MGIWHECDFTSFSRRACSPVACDRCEHEAESMDVDNADGDECQARAAAVETTAPADTGIRFTRLVKAVPPSVFFLPAAMTKQTQSWRCFVDMSVPLVLKYIAIATMAHQ